MSANIVRSIVAQLFSIKPQHFILSGEISPDFNINAGESYSSSAGESWETFEVYSWEPKGGLKKIENDQSWSTGSGNRYNASELPLHEIATGNELFFVIKATENRGTWNDNATKESLTLFKAPDFQAKWNSIESSDVARWEEWANG